MQVENHKEGVPFEYYVNLFKDLDPAEAQARTGAAFDGSTFTLRLVNAEYKITWPQYSITADREDAFALKSLPGQTFLLRWLLEGKMIQARGLQNLPGNALGRTVYPALHRPLPDPCCLYFWHPGGEICCRHGEAGCAEAEVRRCRL